MLSNAKNRSFAWLDDFVSNRIGSAPATSAASR
jgi:hypothetical protein